MDCLKRFLDIFFRLKESEKTLEMTTVRFVSTSFEIVLDFDPNQTWSYVITDLNKTLQNDFDSNLSNYSFTPELPSGRELVGRAATTFVLTLTDSYVKQNLAQDLYDKVVSIYTASKDRDAFEKALMSFLGSGTKKTE